MKKILFLIALVFFSSLISAQQLFLKGKVVDRAASSPLSYASIRIIGTSLGTTTNFEGKYELRLKPGVYKLAASYIGYKTDTVTVNLTSNKTIDFPLQSISVHLSEITVLPGENPALEIIRRAIDAKHVRNDKLNSYVFHAYTKGMVKTTSDFTSSGTSVSISIGTGKKDSSDLKITGIIENESKGYFKKPNKYKDEIIARKQSANTPSQINILTGGRMLQNFYSDDIRFFNRALLSPIADEAIEFYDYLIEDTLAMDMQSVFKIHFEPLNRINPGFVGTLYISDKTYSLIKLDVNLNAAANPGRILDKINILQQYTLLGDDITMPIDYRIFAEGNIFGLAKFGFELNSIFYDYQINDEISDNFFDKIVIKVLPDADKKDSLYWKSTQTIPTTLDEKQAYKRIDSVEAITKGFWENFSLLSTSIAMNKNWFVSGPLSLYSFNRVEGHTLNLGTRVSELFDRRLNGNSDFSYGFSDQKIKVDLSASYYIGEYRTSQISFRAFDKLTDLFSESIRFSKLTSTLTNLFGKYDFRDYYYTRGFSVGLWSQVFPVLSFGMGFFNRTDNTAVNNTDFSIFNKSKVYNSNQAIFDTKVNAITANFQLDFRDFIEDGYFRRKFSQGGAYVMLTGYFIFSNSEMLKSNLDFQMYRMAISGNVPTFRSANLSFILMGIHSEGTVPFQMMYALPGNIESASQSFSLRTIRTGEIFGDRVLTLSLENNFSDELFRLLHLVFLVDLQLNLSVHFNAALLEVSPKSKLILPNPFTEFKRPFYEIGFGIGQSIFPFKLEFTWKLNYLGTNNFVIGINTPIL